MREKCGQEEEDRAAAAEECCGCQEDLNGELHPWLLLRVIAGRGCTSQLLNIPAALRDQADEDGRL